MNDTNPLIYPMLAHVAMTACLYLLLTVALAPAVCQGVHALPRRRSLKLRITSRPRP